MNDKERFLAVCRGEQPDYVPIFGFSGAPGMSNGCMATTHDNLIETGMPAYVGGRMSNWVTADLEGWSSYWGATCPISLDFNLAWGEDGFKTTSRIENGYEIVESESGEITRQVLDNSVIYSMPDFTRFAVRDRPSWEFYQNRTTPKEFMSSEDMEINCRRYDGRDKPLCISAGGTYGTLRNLMGPENISLTMYDDPELVHDIVRALLHHVKKHVYPLIERLKPEIVNLGEDLCYNHGMLLSPAQFEEFFADYYRDLTEFAWANGTEIVAVDTDGNAMEFTGLIERCGVNAMYPFEVKAGNDLFTLRENHPEFVMFGGLEKECINAGNEEMIEKEIMAKVPPLLAKGRYFPNGDHGIQPLATYPNLRKFMTLLHEVCGNPEGSFERA